MKTQADAPDALSLDRRIALLLAAALALSTVVPTATAHTCNNQAGDCGECVEGERHEHNDRNGQCSTTASGIPGFTGGLLVAAVGVALAIGVLWRA